MTEMKDVSSTSYDKNKTMTSSEIKEIVYDVRTFYYNEKYEKISFILNIVFAVIAAYITNFNCILFVLCFIAFDFCTGFFDDFVMKMELKKSMKKIKTFNDFKRVMDSYNYTWDWNSQKDDIFYLWYKGLEKEFKRQEKIEEENNIKVVPKVVRKDEISIMDSMNLFRGAFLNLTNDRDISVFKPCINACDFIESKMREGMVFRGTFAKQFTVYMDEFVKDLNAWSGFTVQQKDDHYNDTLLASETFERWVKKGVEAIEKDVASSLRVSVKTLVDMMEEDISEVQTSIDLKEQKERENDNED